VARRLLLSAAVKAPSLAIALLLLLGCGQVVDPDPSKTGAMNSPAGSASPDDRANTAGTNVEPKAGGSGGVGGGQPIPPTRDGGTAVDASVPPKPAADGGSGKADAGTVSAEPLCDGSADLRLTYESGGGFVETTYFFTNPRGSAFFGVDGKCQFYAGQNYMRGIVSGTLTEPQAAELSKAVHWDELAGWDWSVNKDQSCPDAGGSSLTRAKMTAGCSCGCDPTAPKGLDEALSSASEWVERLMKQGKPSEGPLSAVAFPSDRFENPDVPVLTWPLSRAMSSIPSLVHAPPPEYLSSTDPTARFDDPSEVTKLREARAATWSHAAMGAWSNYVPVQEGSMQYRLYVRDELPPATEKAWETLNATLPKAP
jgi:hypothetical protein